MSGEDKELMTSEEVESVEGMPEEGAKETDTTTVGGKSPEHSKSKKSKKPKKKKPKFVDDGRTVYSMEGLSKHGKSKDSLDLSKKEKRALIKAAFAHYLPIFLGVLGCFAIAAIILYLWLH